MNWPKQPIQFCRLFASSLTNVNTVNQVKYSCNSAVIGTVNLAVGSYQDDFLSFQASSVNTVNFQ